MRMSSTPLAVALVAGSWLVLPQVAAAETVDSIGVSAGVPSTADSPGGENPTSRAEDDWTTEDTVIYDEEWLPADDDWVEDDWVEDDWVPEDGFIDDTGWESESDWTGEPLTTAEIEALAAAGVVWEEINGELFGVDEYGVYLQDGTYLEGGLYLEDGTFVGVDPYSAGQFSTDTTVPTAGAQTSGAGSAGSETSQQDGSSDEDLDTSSSDDSGEDDVVVATDQDSPEVLAFEADADSLPLGLLAGAGAGGVTLLGAFLAVLKRGKRKNLDGASVPHDAVTHDAVTHDAVTHDAVTHDAVTHDAADSDASRQQVQAESRPSDEVTQTAAESTAATQVVVTPAASVAPVPVPTKTATETELPVVQVLDASRRMTGSLDMEEIVEIALSEALQLVGATSGMFVSRASALAPTDENSAQSASELTPLRIEGGEVFNLDNLWAGTLRRVFDTGQSTVSVLTSEPVLASGRGAVLAVPVVVGGVVAHTILIQREEAEPFNRVDLETLELLAPSVGSALHSAVTHGSATKLADVEPMTGLKNRRCLDRDLAQLDRGSVISYFMIDVDYFKNFNDSNGHAAGDEALRSVADRLSENVRPDDIVYRYGGEEFCVLLLGTDVKTAAIVAERVRAAVEATLVAGESTQPGGRLTVSIGVADTATEPMRSLVERADAALYKAKHSGRNQISIDGQNT